MTTRNPRRKAYRQGKRLLLEGLLARSWRGPRERLEPVVRRFLAGRTRGYLLRLTQDRAFDLAAGAAVVAAGQAWALPPVNLSDVAAGAGGFVMNGVDPSDYSGARVSGAGDVNGDGLDDVIIGASFADPAGNSVAGESYVVFGKADGTPVNLSAVAAGSGGFVINGIDPGDVSGYSVSGAGDVNGDGLDDVVVGAWLADAGGNGNAGESYVVFGKTTTTAVDLSSVAAGIGGFVINGIDPDDHSGVSVSGAGDVNGDGLHDVIVGAWKADPAGNSNAGESYVVFSPVCRWDCDGSDDGIANVLDLLALLAQYDLLSPVKCAGGPCDYNDDGCVDLADVMTLMDHFDPAGLGCL